MTQLQYEDGEWSPEAVPDSPDLRPGTPNRTLRTILRDYLRALLTEDEAVDAVLAVVGQGVSAEQAWDEGFRTGFQEARDDEDQASRWWDSDTPNPHRAVVRPDEREG